VFDAPKALLLDGGDDLAVAEDHGGGVSVESVDAEDDHEETPRRTTAFTAALFNE